MDWLAWVFGNSPLLYVHSMFAYVMITLILTCVMSLPSGGRGAWGAAVLAVVVADLVFTFSVVAVYGVHSTISIMTFLLLFVGAAVASPVAAMLHALRRRAAREPPTDRN